MDMKEFQEKLYGESRTEWAYSLEELAGIQQFVENQVAVLAVQI